MALNIPMVLPGAAAKTPLGPAAPKGGEFAALFMQKLQRPDLLDPLAAAGLASFFAQMPPPQVTANAPPGTSPPNGTAPPQTGSPPSLAALGSSPPQTAAPPGPQQQQTAGQKNEFSGNILDAVPAKDIPAPQTTPTALTGLPASAADAFAQAPLVPQRQGQPQPQLPLNLQPQSPQPQQAPQTQQPLQAQPPLQTPQPAQTPQPLLQPQLQQLLQVQPQADLSVQSPDPLARMIARAAAADTQRGGNAPAVRQMPAMQTQQSAAQNAATNGITNAAAAAFAKSLVTAAAQQQSQQSPHQQQQQQSAPQQSGQTQTATLPAGAVQPQIAAQPSAAQPPAHSDAPLTDPHAVVEQIVKSIVVHTGGTQSEVRLRLQPEHLGDVSLKLTVTGNTIAANVIAQNADVRDVLLANTQQLARSLADAGLSLGNFSVDVSGGNAGFTEQRPQTPQSSLKMRAIGSLDEPEEQPWSDPRYGPPLVSGASSLVLNYLA